MLTVAQALSLTEFHGAQVVAGSAGLDKPVGWVHVASVPDAPNWLNGGELVLTTANSMPQGAGEQMRYVQAMAERGVAALALAVGRYISAAPPHMRAVADAHAFPLIELPYQARFVDIAKAVNERITQENMATVERALTIHRVLTQLVLDNADLQDLAEKLAGLVGQSVSIENERFEILASANIAPVDEARRYTLSEGRTDPRLVTALELRGVLGELRRTRRPVWIPQMPDVGLELERVLAPVIVHGEIYGYMWIIADDRPINQLDRLAIESGATIAAVILLHQESLLAAEASLKGGLIAQLIAHERIDGRDALLADQALRYGVDLSLAFVVLLGDLDERSSHRLLSLYRRMNRLAGTENWSAVVGQFAGQLIVVAQANDDLSPILDALVAQPGVRVGVSATATGAHATAAAYAQATDALYIMRRLAPDARIAPFDQLGYLHALYRAGADSLTANPYVAPVRRLRAESGADLFHTLEVYLDAGANGVATAEALTIHRSTLNYRLERIEAITALDLSDPRVCTNLQMALKLVRLFD